MAELHELTALEQWDALHRREVGPLELVRHYLDRIERFDGELVPEGDRLGAFVAVDRAGAEARARDLDDLVPRTAALWGLPFADKDLVARAGVPTRYGSKLFAGNVPTRSDEIALVMDRAGGVSLGKTATPEFGMYGYTTSRVGQPSRNPWDPTLGTGGSSGGAAAAVAARLLPFAPASDGGGSIRIPAAACGLVGVKPSRGLVPAASGVDKLAGLLVAGPIARTVADAALLLDGMIERRNGRIDHHFTLRAPDDNDGPFLGHAIRGEGRFQLAVLQGTPWDTAYDIRIEDGAQAAVDRAVEALGRIGHGIEEIHLRDAEDYPAAFTTIWQASAAGIPARTEEQLALLEPITRMLVERGRALSAETLLETFATMSRFERSVIAQFSAYDAVITPSLARAPLPIGSYDLESPERNFEQQVLDAPHTSFVNVTGLPAITIPVHHLDAFGPEGIPAGVQLIGRPGGEATLFAIAAQLERRFHWQDRIPSIGR